MDILQSTVQNIDDPRHKLWFMRVAGMIYGFAVGDALGLQCDKMTNEAIKYRHPSGVKSFHPKREYVKNGIRNGDWTDETDQLIVAMDTMINTGWRFCKYTFATLLAQWGEHGFKEFGDTVGQSITGYLYRLISTEGFKNDPHGIAAGFNNPSIRATNEAMTRVPILSVSKKWMPTVIDSVLCTNSDPRCITTAIVYGNLLHGILMPSFDIVQDDDEYLREMINTIAARYIDDVHQIEYERYMRIYFVEPENVLKYLGLDSDEMENTFVTLGVILYAFRACRERVMLEDQYDDIYTDIVLNVINHGGDTDGNAAHAGSIVAAILGYKFVPPKWIEHLLYNSWLAAKFITFLSAC